LNAIVKPFGVDNVKLETEVKEILLRTHNVKSFRFLRPSRFEYKPGQFMFVTIKIGDREAKKHFTISSSPTESGFLEFTKKLTGHEFSNALDALKVGDWVQIDGPYGKFTLDEDLSKIGMLSGGIGITPLRSMIKYSTDMKLDCDITLLYANRTEEDIVFREELEGIQQKRGNLKVVFTLTGADENWTGYSRRIDKEMILKEIPDYKKRVFFTCGPPGLVTSMETLLKEVGISQDRIRKEYFPGY
jgi:ferredoxin-NADP reductase